MTDERIRTPWGKVPFAPDELEQLNYTLQLARETRDFDSLNLCTQRMQIHYETLLATMIINDILTSDSLGDITNSQSKKE